MNYHLDDTQKTERLMNSVMDTYTDIYTHNLSCLFSFRSFIKVDFSIPLLKRAAKEGICYRNGNASDCTFIALIMVKENRALIVCKGTLTSSAIQGNNNNKIQ